MTSYITYITYICMARGPSGKVVIEPGSELKKDLYLALQIRGISLKDWFCGQARELINETDQPTLPGIKKGKNPSALTNIEKRKR